MADFKTHVSFSTAAGALYGVGIWMLDVPAPTCAIAGGICAIAGMFPDIDSKTSRALQEALYLMAGLVCMLVLLRLRDYDLNGDLVLTIGAATFLLAKFAVGEIVVHTTVHRGMIHSIPTALIAGALAYLLAPGPCAFRIIKAVALVIGFLSHLVLDEIYSVDFRGVRLKKSFGTALKFTSVGRPGQTIFIYSLLAVLGCFIVYEETLSEKFTGETGRLTSESIKALERYSQAVYSDEWEQYQWLLAMSSTWPNKTREDDHSEEELLDEYEPPSIAKPAFSREPISRNAYPASTSGSIKPYQPPEQSQKQIEWGSVPSATPRNSIFKSTPHSPTGL